MSERDVSVGYVDRCEHGHVENTLECEFAIFYSSRVDDVRHLALVNGKIYLAVYTGYGTVDGVTALTRRA